MRAVLVGASTTAVLTAQILLDRGHEVVVVEAERSRIDALYDELDCSYLHGDGSKPAILREARPEDTDILFCLTDNDSANIIASLVGRSLGFRRIVTAIADPEFEAICRELELELVISPPRTISRYLADVAEGGTIVELATFIRGEARFFSFVAGDAENGSKVDELELPDDARVICLYRAQELIMPTPGHKLRIGDEVVLLTHSRNLPDLHERWSPTTAEDESS